MFRNIFHSNIPNLMDVVQPLLQEPLYDKALVLFNDSDGTIDFFGPAIFTQKLTWNEYNHRTNVIGNVIDKKSFTHWAYTEKYEEMSKGIVCVKSSINNIGNKR